MDDSPVSPTYCEALLVSVSEKLIHWVDVVCCQSANSNDLSLYSCKNSEEYAHKFIFSVENIF